MRRTIDDEVLRCLGHVRAQVDAGEGSETIIASLARHGFGVLSKRLTGLLSRMLAGEAFEPVMRRELEVARSRPQERGYALLLGALMSETSDLDERFQNITTEVMVANKAATEAHTARVNRLSYLILIEVMLTMLLPVAHILVDAVNSAELGEAIVIDDRVVFGPLLCVVLVELTFMVRWR
jgi:hypothetical protein